MLEIDLSKFEKTKVEDDKDFECRDLYYKFTPLSVEEQKLIYFMILDALDELYAKKPNKVVNAQIGTYQMFMGMFYTCAFEKEIGTSQKRVLLSYVKKRLEEWEKSKKKC